MSEIEAQKEILTSKKDNENLEEILESYKEPKPQTVLGTIEIEIQSNTAKSAFSVVGPETYLFLVSNIYFQFYVICISHDLFA